MSDVERELRAELLRADSTGDCLEKENAGLLAAITELHAEVERLRADVVRLKAGRPDIRFAHVYLLDRAERAEADLAKTIAVIEDLLPWINCRATQNGQLAHDRAVDLLAKVKP